MLERVVAIPYELDGRRAARRGRRSAETSTASTSSGSRRRYQLDLGVASSEDILAELRRMARASEAFGARAVLEEAEDDFEETEEEADDLEAEDGVSDAPLVRLVNSIIFQAAEDGASDVHFEPQEDALVVRFRVDGVLAEVAADPAADGRRASRRA